MGAQGPMGNTEVTVPLSPSVPQSAPLGAYLKIDGIKGESADNRHKDWIEVLSFSHEIDQALSVGGAGKATFSDLQVTKRLDKSSPKLMEAVAAGKHIATAELHVTRLTGDGSVTYLTYELQDVLISSYQVGTGSSGDRPHEEVTLAFAKIKVIYTESAPDGGEAGRIEFTWNLAANKP